MLKQVLLAVGVISLYLAAKEYGINSLDDLKAKLGPLLKVVDLEELTHLEEETEVG